MGTFIHVKCIDCRDNYYPETREYYSDVLYKLVDAMPAFQKVLNGLSTNTIPTPVHLVPGSWCVNTQDLTHFVMCHGNHRLMVYNEYNEPVVRPI